MTNDEINKALELATDIIQRKDPALEWANETMLAQALLALKARNEFLEQTFLNQKETLENAMNVKLELAEAKKELDEAETMANYLIEHSMGHTHFYAKHWLEARRKKQ